MARILAQAGLRLVGPAPTAPVPALWYLWPCNVRTWQLWCGLQTQWRIGMAGATGLDYAAVWSLLDRSGLRPRARREAFEHLCAMEQAVLEVWADRREREVRR